MARFLALIVATTLFWAPTSAPANAADQFTPRPGPTYNSPIGDTKAKRAIFGKILRSIDGARRGSDIKILSWNFLTREGTDALLRAQRHHVRVRVLIDASNTERFDNQPFTRLQRGLRRWNHDHPHKRRSWARACDHSCRGHAGAAHAKFFLFSHVGDARNVVIEGSANFTRAAAYNQWNDVFTFTRRPAIYKFMSRIFDQASHDKPVRGAFARHSFGDYDLVMFPLGGAKDPVMKLLNQVRCKGADNTGPKRRTVIRIAPDVIRQKRGMALATKVRELWNQGCDIRIGYTVVGIDVGRMLRDRSGRGPVPMKHLVQDFNGDGEFDNYFHIKAMTIVGHMRRNRSSYVTLNGSANWSSLARASDENIGVFRDERVTLRYQEHLDYWYDNFPESQPTTVTDPSQPTARRAVSDRLVFGTGNHAVYEDGTPYSTTGVDPYAHLQLD